MTALTLAITAAAMLIVAWYVFAPAAQAYRRFRGQLVVTCPETGSPVAATVNVKHLASSAAQRSWDMRIGSCARWPERESCAQGCLSEVDEAIDTCSVRERLNGWYRSQSCVKCGKVFGVIDSYDHVARVSYDKKPALLSPEDEIVEWKDVDPPQLLTLLETHSPICWDCSVIKTFRDNKPDWVLDRDFTYHNMHF